jgi:hypothetical protein
MTQSRDQNLPSAIGGASELLARAKKICSSGRSSILSRDATEITPMAGDVRCRSLFFTCNFRENKRMQGLEVELAIRG